MRVHLRTKKAIDAAERAAARFDSAKKNLEVMKSKRFKSAPVKWLVKYEYHV